MEIKNYVDIESIKTTEDYFEENKLTKEACVVVVRITKESNDAPFSVGEIHAAFLLEDYFLLIASHHAYSLDKAVIVRSYSRAEM